MIENLTIKKRKNQIKAIKLSQNSIDYFLTIIIFATIILIIINPKRYSNGTIEGIKLFFYSVMPGLFPFMLLTKILTELGIVEQFFSKFDKFTIKIFGTSGISLYVLFMSIISGYPIGAKIICDLYCKGIIDKEDAKRMSIFCTTSGPSFVIGTIGTIMFNNYKYGIILYFSHILSSILLGIIFNILHKNRVNFNKNKRVLHFSKQKNIVGYSISETISSLFVVCAYITIFYLIGELLQTIKVLDLINNCISFILNIFKIDAKYSNGLTYGILEVTRGAKCLSTLSDNLAVILTTGILSFSGLSIIFQSMAFLKQAQIKTHTFIFSKCVHSLLSMLFCFIILHLFA